MQPPVLTARSKGPFKRMRLIIQAVRIGVFALLLALAILVHFSQSVFFNWEIYWQFYVISALGLISNFVGLLVLDRFFENDRWLSASFFADIFLIAVLLHKTELSVSLFLFVFLIEILLMALVFRTRGALMLAAFCSVSFSLVSLLGPEMKAMTFFFTLILYNIAFFLVAWISGMLAEQLESQGLSLSNLRALNDSIIQTIPSGLISITREGEILTANPGAVEIFRVPNLDSENLIKLIPEIAPIFNQQKLNPSSNDTFSFEAELPLRRDGDDLLIKLKVIEQKTENSDYLVMVEDVTEIRRLELMLMHQQKLSAIGGLASGIAHELGNPLAAVSANIQFLEPKIKIEDETDRRLIQNTHREIARLGRLIGEFKDYAKPERIPVDKVRLDQIMKSVLDVVQSDKTLRAGVLVHTDFEVVPTIMGSTDKLTQSFLNVLINAYHAVNESEDPEIHIGVKAHDHGIAVSVKDNGVGMSEETKARLFEPFYTTKGRHGTGLGLAMVFKIMQAHEAQISVESKKGQGTEFMFRFPIKISKTKS